MALAIMFSASCFAFTVDAPQTIVIGQEPKDFPVTVTNNGETIQDYSAEFFGPFEASITPSFGSIPAGKSTILSLSVTPKEELEGSTYDALLEVTLGEKKAFKNVRVVFKEAEEAQGNDEQETPAGFFSFGEFSAFVFGLFTLENWLNLVLAVAAAILLIAFIARFVKRLEARK